MWIRQRQTVCAMWLAAPLRGALLGCSITWLGNVDWSKPSRWWFWVTAPPGFGTWSPNTFQRQCRLWISIMPKNTCGTWLTPSLDAAQQWEQLGPRTPVRSLNKGRVKRSSPRSRRCRPFHRNQGKPAVSLNGPWITLPPTPSACAIPSSVLKGCTSAVASPRPLAKASLARAPNAAACAGLLRASMPSCLCARRFSMGPMIHSGKRNMPLDCLQPIHTPIQGIAKSGGIQSKRMLLHKLAIELEPEFLDGIGPGRIGGQGQQADLTVDGRQMLLDIGMKMHGPVIQGDVDHVGLRIVLLHMIEEAVHLLDIEALPSAHQHLPGGDIEHPCQPQQFGLCTRGFGSGLASATIAPPHLWTQVSRMLILVEENDLCGCLHSQIPGPLNLSQFLVVERIRRMDMLASALIDELKAA